MTRFSFTIIALLAATTNAMVLDTKMMAHDNSTIEARSTHSGCVQAHCFAVSDIGVADAVGDAVNVQVHVNGIYTFELIGAKRFSTDSNVWQWNQVTDHNGKKWDIKMTGFCGHLSYRNDWQTTDGWYGLTDVATHKVEDRDCGYCITANCVCVLHEVIKEDTYANDCAGYPSMPFCDYRGPCKTGGQMNNYPDYHRSYSL